MRVSLSITNFSWPGVAADHAAQLRRVVQAADEGDIDTVWVADHLIQADPHSSPEAEMLEAYTTLGFLAAQAQRVRLGTMVTNITHRLPALLVKAVTTLDVLSGGRAWFGIGAGYNEIEARVMGVPFPPRGERFDQLEETLRLALRMWAGDDSPFEGTHFRLERPLNSPNSVQRPHPPILIGGMGEHRTLPLVARYADACNLFDVPDGGDTVRHKLAVLKRHCEAIGRPCTDIDRTLSTRLQRAESSSAFAERCAGLAELGIDHVVVITNGIWDDDALTRLTAAVPAVRDISTR